MATDPRQPLRLVRDTGAAVAAYAGPAGEPVFNRDTGEIHVQDGATPGGIPALARPAYLRREKWKGPHVFDYISSLAHDGIEAGTSTTDVTQGCLDAAAALANTALEGDAKGFGLRFVSGLYNISASIPFSGVGTRLVCDGPAGTVFKARANIGTDKALFEMRQGRAGYSAIGMGFKGARIDMGGFTGHGVRFWKPYNSTVIGNLEIDGLADGSKGLMIVPDLALTPGDPYSQSVFVYNVNAYHANVTATAPLFYIEGLNEATFLLCKGFGTYQSKTSNNTVLPSLNPWELVDCNGVNLINCAGAFANEHAFLVRATNRSYLSRSVIIDTPTIEVVRGIAKFVGAGTASDERLKVLEPELRSPRIVQPYFTHPSGDIILASVRGAVIDAKSATVQMSDTDRCRVRSDGPITNVVGAGRGDRAEFLPSQFPRTNVAAQPATAQAIDAGVYTKVLFGVETADAMGEFDPATSVFKAEKPGALRVEIGLAYAPNTSNPGQVALRLIKNGNEARRFYTRYNAWVLGTQETHAIRVDVAAGDEFYFQFYADMGAVLGLDPAQNYLRITAMNNGYAL